MILDYIEKHNLGDIPEVVVKLYTIMLTISIFACLVRPDFNVVLFILGVFVWLTDSDNRIVFLKTIQFLTKGIVLSLVLDGVWLVFALGSWFCSGSKCDDGMGIKTQWLKFIHVFALILSVMNMALKGLVWWIQYKYIEREFNSIKIFQEQQYHDEHQHSYSVGYQTQGTPIDKAYGSHYQSDPHSQQHHSPHQQQYHGYSPQVYYQH